jgi:hypothetical protein
MIFENRIDLTGNYKLQKRCCETNMRQRALERIRAQAVSAVVRDSKKA